MSRGAAPAMRLVSRESSVAGDAARTDGVESDMAWKGSAAGDVPRTGGDEPL